MHSNTRFPGSFCSRASVTRGAIAILVSVVAILPEYPRLWSVGGLRRTAPGEVVSSLLRHRGYQLTHYYQFPDGRFSDSLGLMDLFSARGQWKRRGIIEPAQQLFSAREDDILVFKTALNVNHLAIILPRKPTKMLVALSDLEWLEQLTLTRPESFDEAINDADLVGLERLTALDDLSIIGHQISRETILRISGIHKLKRLRLVPAWKPGPRPLNTVKDFQEILKQRKAPWITDDAIRPLGSLGDLRSLEVEGAELTGTGFDSFAELRSLDTLYLPYSGINDQGLKIIGSLPHLRHVVVRGTLISDKGLENLAKSKSLEYVDLSECPYLTDAGIEQLACAPRLRVIDAHHTKISAECADRLVKKRKLTKIVFGYDE